MHPCVTSIQPYQEAASGTQEKYNDDYDASTSRIQVTSAGAAIVNLTLAADKTTAAAGEKVQFTANFAAQSGEFGDTTSGSPAVAVVSIPANSVYISGSATSSESALLEYSIDGGKSWLQSAPGNLSTVTHLRWIFSNPIDATLSTLSYSVQVTQSTTQCLNSTAGLGLLNSESLTSDTASLNCAPTPTPTATPQPIATAEFVVQSGADGGLESGTVARRAQ